MNDAAPSATPHGDARRLERTRSHPDRAASTLANIDEERLRRGGGPFTPPGDGAADCRIELKQLAWRAYRAAERSPRARERLAALSLATRPDLAAGTVQDGVARGLAVAFEEALSFAPNVPPLDLGGATVVTGKDLRKRKDLLVKSGGSRVRFSRKEGLLYVDRDGGAHSANCLRFEARRDLGTLDGFVGDDAERPRIYSAQFLQPQRYVQGAGITQLLLAGRLGRGPVGWACELEVTGRDDEPTLLLRLRIDNRLDGWRLRARFLGIPLASIEHECTPVHEVVANDAGGFVAFTLVRSCGTLLVDGAPVAVPAAQCRGPIEHRFRLGSALTSS